MLNYQKNHILIDYYDEIIKKSDEIYCSLNITKKHLFILIFKNKSSNY